MGRGRLVDSEMAVLNQRFARQGHWGSMPSFSFRRRVVSAQKGTECTPNGEDGAGCLDQSLPILAQPHACPTPSMHWRGEGTDRIRETIGAWKEILDWLGTQEDTPAHTLHTELRKLSDTHANSTMEEHLSSSQPIREYMRTAHHSLFSFSSSSL